MEYSELVKNAIDESFKECTEGKDKIVISQKLYMTEFRKKLIFKLTIIFKLKVPKGDMVEKHSYMQYLGSHKYLKNYEHDLELSMTIMEAVSDFILLFRKAI